MRLTQAHITNFQSVRDSNPIPIGDITCLLGKNEAGKTAVLKALYRLNPINENEGDYDVMEDFPRTALEEYERSQESGAEPATVARATFNLELDDLEHVQRLFGPEVLHSSVLTVSKGYDNSRTFSLDVNERAAYRYYVDNIQVPDSMRTAISQCHDFRDLAGIPQDPSHPEDVRDVIKMAREISEQGLDRYIYLTFLRPRLPRFVYFDEYYQLRGYENLNSLKERLDTGQLQPSDYPILGLLNVARLDIEQLLNPGRTQLLVTKLENASTTLNRQIFKYWSQNQHLQMRFDVRPGQPNDPEGTREGINLWASVFDTRNATATLLGSRSRGFVWFFSFLAWYSQLRDLTHSVILLLDEPGHSLHAKAQMDLLRFFEDDVRPQHQLVYSAHSPFMVDREHPERICVVEDRDISSAEQDGIEHYGTKVFTELNQASEDTLIPILVTTHGQEVLASRASAPTAPPPEPEKVIVEVPVEVPVEVRVEVPVPAAARNNLLVEDITDFLYIQAISSIFKREGRQGLGGNWLVVPVGGVENVPSYLTQVPEEREGIAALFGLRNQDRELFNAFRERRVLAEDRVSTYIDFVGLQEAAVEDMFDTDFYVNLVNAAYRNVMGQPITLESLPNSGARLRDRVSEHFRLNPLPNMVFSHRRPARLFADNVDKLKGEVPAQAMNRFALLFAWLDSLSNNEE